MQPFTQLKGIVAPVDRANVDTDAIIPKQFLKRIERSGFGQFLFHDWRFLNNGEPNPDFELNKEKYAGASILIARQNFGCGSSREHAPWSLLDYGFQVIISSSYADIFYNNCFKNGILPIILDEETVDGLFQRTYENEGYQLTVSLEEQLLKDEKGLEISFEVDAFRKYLLLNGLDDIGLTLLDENKITEYEEQQAGVKLKIT
jgi:3-isopropylmalate/(R)-2-methylmalate dehydratase small subunit